MVFNNSILAGAGGQGGAVESFRFYRLNVTAGQNSNLLIVAEIAILDSSGTNQFPTMTSNTAPSPNVTSTNRSIFSTFDAFKACDKNINTHWGVPAGASSNPFPAQWNIDLGSGNTIDKPAKLALTNLNSGDNEYWPVDFTLQASNDDSTYTTLLTVTGMTASSVGQTNTFTIP